LEYNFFWIGSARIRREKILVKFRRVLEWPIQMQPGKASITDKFHEPEARIAATEAGKEPESTQV